MSNDGMTSLTDLLNRDAAERFQSLFANLFPASPNTRYWQFDNYQYHYTTECVDGKFWAMIYKPAGKGARTGKQHSWKLQKKVGRVRRKDAKALAYKWYTQAKMEQQS